MKVSVLIGSYGDLEWAELAIDRALPSVPHHPDVQVLVWHDAKATLAGIRNALAEKATGDWLCFLDADDELAPGYLDAMRATMRHWNLARRGDLVANPLLLAPAVQYDGAAPELPNRHQPMSVLNHCVIGTLVPRLLFLQVGGFRDDLPIYEDWALFLACVRAGARVVDVPGAVYRVHFRPGSRNNADGAVALATYDRIREEHEAA